jgi:biotin carboxyl carrier protein
MKFRATVDGREYAVDVQPGPRPGAFTVVIGGRECRVDLASTARGWLHSLLLNGRSLQVVSLPRMIEIEGQAYEVEVERDIGLARTRAAASQVADLKAPIPGLVVAVHVQPGDEVQEGQALVVLEAMKMQMELKSPRSGHVASVAAKPGHEVNQGQVLITVDA